MKEYISQGIAAAAGEQDGLLDPHRRQFLGILGIGVVGAAVAGQGLLAASESGTKTLRGIFPIAQTPFTDSNQLDLDALVKELNFIHRAGAQGFVWPQMTSEYTSLSKPERIAGAEAIVAAARRLRPAVVIGVQASDVAGAVEYARHAEKTGADAIISLPPANQTNPEVLIEYYGAIGKACHLPLFAQTVGDLSVETIVRISKAVPTLRYVKDEAGKSALARIGPLREQSGDTVKVFTGNHSKTLIDEMERGTSGSMPAASFADLQVAVWNQWHAGRRKEAIDLFSKALLFITEVQDYGIRGLKYILYLRGIFPNYAVRSDDGNAALDDSAKKTLREIFEFAKPSFIA